MLLDFIEGFVLVCSHSTEALDVNDTLRRLLELNISLNNVNIRQHNLEDLFLHLTGKELRV